MSTVDLLRSSDSSFGSWRSNSWGTGSVVSATIEALDLKLNLEDLLSSPNVSSSSTELNWRVGSATSLLKELVIIKQEVNMDLISQEELLAIRFSQDSVSPTSMEGENLHKVIRSAGWDKSKRITLVEMPDGKITSLDNRRLVAIKKIVSTAANFFTSKKPVTAIKYSHQAPADESLISHLRRQYFAKLQVQSDLQIPVSEKTKLISGMHLASLKSLGLEPDSYGELIYLRMKIGGRNSLDMPYGFNEMPIERAS